MNYMKSLNEYIKLQLKRNRFKKREDISELMNCCCESGKTELTLESAAQIYSPYYTE